MMDDILNVWFISRNGVQSDVKTTLSYDIRNDYLSAEPSSFTFKKTDNVCVAKGDFILAKVPNGGGNSYFGVVDSQIGDSVKVMGILGLVDFAFPATYTKGPSFESHVNLLLHRYLIDDPHKILNILDVSVITNTPHIYQPAEQPTSTNLLRYLINGFKKYNVVWRFDGFIGGRIKTSLVRIEKRIQVKDNILEIKDWDVSTVEVGTDVFNQLYIVNKAMRDSTNPVILATFWLTNDNEVTTNGDDPRIIKPTLTTIFPYDLESEDEEYPTYQEVAESEIKGSYYSHEITFSIPKYNNFIPIYDIEVGMFTKISYRGRIYDSILSGISMDSEGPYMELKFGHIRSTLSELLE